MQESLTRKLIRNFNWKMMSDGVGKNVGFAERLLSLTVGTYLLYRELNNLSSRSLIGVPVSMYLMFRGGTGHCPLSRWMGKKDAEENPAVNIKAVMTVNRPRELLYRYWRKLSNLPTFMLHLKEVKELDKLRSHWIAEMPGMGGTMEWDAEIVKDDLNERIGWQSAHGALIKNVGKVEFFDAPNGGTEVRVIFSYHPPAGGLGTVAAKLLNPLGKAIIEKEIYNFKRLMEADELPLIEDR